MIEKLVKTDVLVIGGGMAGCFAAIKAREQGLNVTLADKSFIGKAGATHYADGNLVFFRPSRGHRLNDWINLICQRGEYLNNRDWIKICLEECEDRYNDMVSYGMPFYKPDGKLFINSPDPSWEGMDDIVGGLDRGSLWENVDLLYRKHAPALREKARSIGVDIQDRMMFSELMTQDGQIAGAMGFNTTSGDLYIFDTPAVVIATGGGGFKAECNWTNYWTGDGESMAYRAGAAISSQEFGRIGTDMPMRAAAKKAEGERGEGITGKVVNNLIDAPFMGGMVTGWLRPNLNADGVPAISAAYEAHRGKAPLYTNLDIWSERQMKWMHYYRATRGSLAEDRVGFDIFQRGKVTYPATRIWASPTAAGSGIWPVDQNCGSRVPGLYAAGDTCATMASGASYAGMGFGLNHAAVTGARAGRGAADHAKKTKTVLDRRVVDQMKQTVCAPMERKSGFSPAWLSQIVQTITVPYFYLGVKHGDRLQAAVTIAEFVNSHLAPQLMAKDPHDWRMAQEAKNMAHMAEMRLKASLFRTESRGTHFREDYPRRDDPAWLAWVKLQDEGGRMKVYKDQVPEKWWPDLNKPYEERYPRMFPGE
jgi:succinate dehydrogenase/fumarate reductase flavoprotein subunit